MWDFCPETHLSLHRKWSPPSIPVPRNNPLYRLANDFSTIQGHAAGHRIPTDHLQ